MSNIKNITARLGASTHITAAEEPDYKQRAEQLSRKLKANFNNADVGDGTVRVDMVYDEDDEAYIVVVQGFTVDASPIFMAKVAKSLLESNMKAMFLGTHKGKPALMFMA